MNSYNLDAAGITLPDKPATPTPAKAPRKPKEKSPRAERTIDPRIQAANDKRNETVAEIRREDRSERIYRVFTEKRWPQLTPAYQVKTSEFVNAKVTPPLPLN